MQFDPLPFAGLAMTVLVLFKLRRQTGVGKEAPRYPVVDTTSWDKDARVERALHMGGRCILPTGSCDDRGVEPDVSRTEVQGRRRGSMAKS